MEKVFSCEGTSFCALLTEFRIILHFILYLLNLHGSYTVPVEVLEDGEQVVGVVQKIAFSQVEVHSTFFIFAVADCLSTVDLRLLVVVFTARRQF